ncbi:VOC family protein [Novosphingobium colocasiae]|uniref:Oxidoreductase n=1 Tax=Novosphingobium colocasiae TaxID=1256513 RepID=A0A918UD34_9SPHN|nr:VOC family protein [Novosphingobium colocasiae]GGY90349.1 oxidoreductase [Novosphingobium colocasiae]
MAHPLRFARLGYCRLSCPDLEASIAFYRGLVGMTLAGRDEKTAWLRCSDKPYDIVLDSGDAPGISMIGFELASDQELDSAYAIAEDLGLDPVWRDAEGCAAMKVARSLLFTDPVTGMELDFYASQQIETAPLDGMLTKIVRMGHVVLNVEDLGAAHDFWVEKFGFAVSDRVEGLAEWLRCWPNPLHHSLALLQSPTRTNTLHHINFMVTDIDDVGGAMNRMKNAEVPIVFGPGRHLPSTSIFLYFLDPDGNTAEFSFGMELFEEEGARPPRELEHKAEVMDTWGGRPDPRFGKGSAVITRQVPVGNA